MSRSEIEKFFSDDDDYKNTELLVGDDSLGIINDNNDDGDGQLSIDMYQTEKDVVVKAPVAGVKEENLEVSVTEDSISIKGHRKKEKEENHGNYHVHECYWGSFSRSQSLPVPVIAEKAEASLKHGLLTITIPKAKTAKGKFLKIRTD